MNYFNTTFVLDSFTVQLQQSLIGCSGLVTLIGTQTSCSDSFIVDEVFAKLPKGTSADAAKLGQDELLIYADYILERKALVIDAKVSKKYSL